VRERHLRSRRGGPESRQQWLLDPSHSAPRV
jgi:hypothetical protein